MPDNKINERLSRIRVIDELFSSDPGKTFLPEKIIECVNVRNPKWNYNRYKLIRDIEFLENDKCLRLKREKCRPSSGVGRTITKYGYNDSVVSIFHDGLSYFDKLLIKDILEILQLKGIDSLGSIIKFEQIYGKKVSKNYSPIISFTKSPNEKKNVAKNLSNLLRLIREKKCVRIKMKDRFDTLKVTTHKVHPWYLREYNRRWYLLGLEENNVEHYALDRIQSLSKYEKQIYKGPNRSIDDILEHVIGINFKKDDKVEEIIFWVSNKSSDFVLSKPMHHTMAKIDIEEIREKVPESILVNLPKDNGVFIKMKCIINYELRREMMSFREELIVLTPNKLRNEIKEILKRMYDNYP